jgi:hypothetical protein
MLRRYAYVFFSLHSVNTAVGPTDLAVRLGMTGAVPPLLSNIMACSGTALLVPTYATVLLKTGGGSVYWFSVRDGYLQIVDLTLEAHHDRCSSDHVFRSDVSFRVLFFFSHFM